MTQTEARQTALTVIEDWKADEEPEKLSFFKGLQVMKAQDDAVINLDFEDFKRVVDAGSAKVDDIHYVLSKFEIHGEYAKRMRKYWEGIEKHCASEAKRMKDYVKYSMIQADIREFPGIEIHVKLCRSKPSVKISVEPTPEMILEFGDYIRTKYEWDKQAIFDGLASGDEKLATFASLEETLYPRFTPRLRAKK